VRLPAGLTPLRDSPGYRWLWASAALSGAGGSVTGFAVTLGVWDLTGSTTATGAIAAVSLLPLLLIALPGGSLADTASRRGLVTASAACSAAVAALFLGNAMLAWGGRLWASYALAAGGAAASALRGPALRASAASLVAPAHLPAAVALDRVTSQAALIAGPALAGPVAGTFGIKGCYLAAAACFAGSCCCAARMPALPVPLPPAPGGDRPSRLRLMREGLARAGSDRVLAGAFLADLAATFFALPVSLFPAVNAQRFGGSPAVLGLLTVAIGAGGMAAAVFSGPARAVSRQGLAMLVTVAASGAGFALFAVARPLWLTLLALGAAGAADSLTVIFRGVIVQRVTPEEFRGRISAADFAVGTGGAQLGSLESGVAGALASPQASALAGGLIAIACALVIAAANPAFRRYRDPLQDTLRDSGPRG
jgi:MFS family permease